MSDVIPGTAAQHHAAAAANFEAAAKEHAAAAEALTPKPLSGSVASGVVVRPVQAVEVEPQPDTVRAASIPAPKRDLEQIVKDDAAGAVHGAHVAADAVGGVVARDAVAVGHATVAGATTAVKAASAPLSLPIWASVLAVAAANAIGVFLHV